MARIFTVNIFLRRTVHFFQFLRLTARFLDILRLTANPIEIPLYTCFISKLISLVQQATRFCHGLQTDNIWGNHYRKPGRKSQSRGCPLWQELVQLHGAQSSYLLKIGLASKLPCYVTPRKDDRHTCHEIDIVTSMNLPTQWRAELSSSSFSPSTMIEQQSSFSPGLTVNG